MALKDYLIISRLRAKMCRIKAQNAWHIVNMAQFCNAETVHFNRKMHAGIKSDLP